MAATSHGLSELSDQLCASSNGLYGIALSEKIAEGSLEEDDFITNLLELPSKVALKKLTEMRVDELPEKLKKVKEAAQNNCGEKGDKFADQKAIMGGPDAISKRDKTLHEKVNVILSDGSEVKKAQALRDDVKVVQGISVRIEDVSEELKKIEKNNDVKAIPNLIMALTKIPESKQSFENVLSSDVKQDKIIAEVSTVLETKPLSDSTSELNSKIKAMCDELEANSKKGDTLADEFAKNLINEIVAQLEVVKQSIVTTKQDGGTMAQGFCNGYKDMDGILKNTQTLGVLPGNMTDAEIATRLDSLVKLNNQFEELISAREKMKLSDDEVQKITELQKDLNSVLEEVKKSQSAYTNLSKCAEGLNIDQNFDETFTRLERARDDFKDFDQTLLESKNELKAVASLFTDAADLLAHIQSNGNANVDVIKKWSKLKSFKENLKKFNNTVQNSKKLKDLKYKLDHIGEDTLSQEFKDWATGTQYEGFDKCLKANGGLQQAKDAKLPQALMDIASNEDEWVKKTVEDLVLIAKIHDEAKKKKNKKSKGKKSKGKKSKGKKSKGKKSKGKKKQKRVKRQPTFKDLKVAGLAFAKGAKSVRNLKQLYVGNYANVEQFISTIDDKIAQMKDQTAKAALLKVWTPELKKKLKEILGALKHVTKTVPSEPVNNFEENGVVFTQLSKIKIDDIVFKEVTTPIKSLNDAQIDAYFGNFEDVVFYKSADTLKFAAASIPSITSFLNAPPAVLKKKTAAPGKVSNDQTQAETTEASGPNIGLIAGVTGGILLAVAVSTGVYFLWKKKSGSKDEGDAEKGKDEENGTTSATNSAEGVPKAAPANAGPEAAGKKTDKKPMSKNECKQELEERLKEQEKKNTEEYLMKKIKVIDGVAIYIDNDDKSQAVLLGDSMKSASKKAKKRRDKKEKKKEKKNKNKSGKTTTVDTKAAEDERLRKLCVETIRKIHADVIEIVGSDKNVRCATLIEGGIDKAEIKANAATYVDRPPTKAETDNHEFSFKKMAHYNVGAGYNQWRKTDEEPTLVAEETAVDRTIERSAKALTVSTRTAEERSQDRPVAGKESEDDCQEAANEATSSTSREVLLGGAVSKDTNIYLTIQTKGKDKGFLERCKRLLTTRARFTKTRRMSQISPAHNPQYIQRGTSSMNLLSRVNDDEFMAKVNRKLPGFGDILKDVVKMEEDWKNEEKVKAMEEGRTEAGADVDDKAKRKRFAKYMLKLPKYGKELGDKKGPEKCVDEIEKRLDDPDFPLYKLLKYMTSKKCLSKKFRSLQNPNGEEFYLTAHVVRSLFERAAQVFAKDPDVLRLKMEPLVIGDVHGSFVPLATILHELQFMKRPVIFLGDYGDRGPRSVCTVLFICLLKLAFPHLVYCIRGNHETNTVNGLYGFRKQCRELFGYAEGDAVWEDANDLFDTLSPCGILNDQIFLVHGGVSEEFEKGPEVLKHVKKVPKTALEIKINEDLLWSDCVVAMNENNDPLYPTCSRTDKANDFNLDALKKIFKAQGWVFMIRGHQVKENGFDLVRGYFMTVFSAPNMRDDDLTNNTAAVIIVRYSKKIEIYQFDDKDTWHTGGRMRNESMKTMTPKDIAAHEKKIVDRKEMKRQSRDKAENEKPTENGTAEKPKARKDTRKSAGGEEEGAAQAVLSEASDQSSFSEASDSSSDVSYSSDSSSDVSGGEEDPLENQPELAVLKNL